MKLVILPGSENQGASNGSKACLQAGPSFGDDNLRVTSIYANLWAFKADFGTPALAPNFKLPKMLKKLVFVFSRPPNFVSHGPVFEPTRPSKM